MLRHVIAVLLLAGSSACAARAVPAVVPEQPIPATAPHLYVPGPALLRFRTGSYAISADCVARCTALGDEWFAEVNCPEGPLRVLAPADTDTRTYENAASRTLANGASVTSGTTSRGGYRVFCAKVASGRDREEVCTAVAKDSARARVLALAESFNGPAVDNTTIDCVRFPGE